MSKKTSKKADIKSTCGRYTFTGFSADWQDVLVKGRQGTFTMKRAQAIELGLVHENSNGKLIPGPKKEEAA